MVGDLWGAKLNIEELSLLDGLAKHASFHFLLNSNKSSHIRVNMYCHNNDPVQCFSDFMTCLERSPRENTSLGRYTIKKYVEYWFVNRVIGSSLFRFILQKNLRYRSGRMKYFKTGYTSFKQFTLWSYLCLYFIIAFFRHPCTCNNRRTDTNTACTIKGEDIAYYTLLC